MKYVFSKKIIIISAVTSVIICLSCVLAAIFQNDDKPDISINNGVFSAFEKSIGITDIECIDEKFAVFTITDGKKGIMSLEGKIIEEAVHDKISVVSENWGIYKYICKGPLSEYSLLIDETTGKITKKQYHGVLSPEVVPCIGDDGNLVMVNRDGTERQIRKSDLSLDVGLYPITTDRNENKKYGYIDEQGTVVIPALYDNALSFSSGIAPVKQNGKWGYIDTNGDTIIPFIYDDINEKAYSVKGGLIPVKKDNLCGIINRNNEPIINFCFDCIIQGKNGCYIVKYKNSWGTFKIDTALYEGEVKSFQQEVSTQSGIPLGEYTVSTSGSALNIRKDASVNSSVLTKIPNGEIITITDSVPGWAYTSYSGSSGWVSDEYLR